MYNEVHCRALAVRACVDKRTALVASASDLPPCANTNLGWLQPSRLAEVAMHNLPQEARPNKHGDHLVILWQAHVLALMPEHVLSG